MRTGPGRSAARPRGEQWRRLHGRMKEMVGGCCVCSDERGWAENPLVYCDGHGCNVAVHQGGATRPGGGANIDRRGGR